MSSPIKQARTTRALHPVTAALPADGREHNLSLVLQILLDH